jgi:hypothetical protein
MIDFDDGVLEFATARQREYLLAWRRYGSSRAAARELGVHPRNILQAKERVQKKAAIRGFSPKHDMVNTVPDGFVVRGVSTYYNSEGKPTGQWVKSSLQHEALLEALRDAVDALKEEIDPVPPVAAPGLTESALCNLYTFTDYHLGMLAWHQEGGEDWDLHIAENILMRSYAYMIDACPKASHAVINIQGDFLHTDGKTPVTPAHGHVLDADSRYPKIRRVAIRVIREMVRIALERHDTVHLVIAEGNHDEEGTGWLSDMMAVVYENEPRLTVDNSALPFYCHQWGTVMLGIHHGHKVKNESLPLLFAAQFPEIWGATKRREIHCGHRHHRDEKEYNGVTVVQHPTLAARDAYAARGGWIADRAAWAITYHREYGAVGRVMVTPEMVR